MSFGNGGGSDRQLDDIEIEVLKGEWAVKKMELSLEQQLQRINDLQALLEQESQRAEEIEKLVVEKIRRNDKLEARLTHEMQRQEVFEKKLSIEFYKDRRRQFMDKPLAFWTFSSVILIFLPIKVEMILLGCLNN